MNSSEDRKRRRSPCRSVSGGSNSTVGRSDPAHQAIGIGPYGLCRWRGWGAAVGARTAYIERGSPWKNGYVESFNARLHGELLDAEVFHSLREAQILIEHWRRHYNTKRPYSAFGYRPAAPESIAPVDRMPTMH